MIDDVIGDTMELQSIQAFIGSLGFPVVCCLIQFYVILKMNKVHAETLNELKRTIDNNTRSIIDLTDSLRGVNRNGQETDK